MNMVIIFDLDDTLYDERMYVEGGFRAVATFGTERFGWDQKTSFLQMIDFLEDNGRGAVFDRWLALYGRHGKGLVKECVHIYRHHLPSLQLCKEAKKLFPEILISEIKPIYEFKKLINFSTPLLLVSFLN